VSQSDGIARIEVLPGRRIIKAFKDGFDEEQWDIDAKSGQTQRVPLKLYEESSTSWWYYAAGAAIVVGGIALLAKKAQENKDKQSTTDPYGTPPPFPGTP